MNKTIFANRMHTLEPSPTLSLDAKVKQLQRSGIAVTNLSIGEPDFDTPAHIRKAAIKAIDAGFTHYTETAGILPLRVAIVEKLKKENNLIFDPSEIIVGVGSKHILYEVFQVLCDKGDEVLIPVPTWSTYVEQVKLAGATVKLIPLQQPFQLTAQDVKKHMTKKTKILLLNSPANPTGAMISKKELQKIAALAISHNIWVVSDEIYEHIVYKQEFISIASFGEKIKQQTITINGVSKAYAMTGWRIGYAAGSKEVIGKIAALQGQLTSNPTSIAQVAAIAALTGNQKPIAKMTTAFAKRRAYLLDALSIVPKISFIAPEGAFYFFVDIRSLLNKTYPTSIAWCEGLLAKEKVAVVPGEAFLYPGHFRLSFSASMENLEKGVKGIKRFVEKNL